MCNDLNVNISCYCYQFGCKEKSEAALTRAVQGGKKVSATLKVSLWFNNRHTLGLYRGLNQSEIVKGGPPPLIGRDPDIPVRVCTFENVCAAAVMQRER